MKRFLFVFTFAVTILIACHGLPLPADVEKLSGTDYFLAVDKTLNAAKKSIFVVMYYIEYKKDESDSKAAILLNDLVKEREKGIDMKVILDRTTVFRRNAVKGKRMEIDGKNMPAFYFLKRHGIDVKFDTLDIYTHGKCVVVDGETVILGSHNWTETSLARSNEYSVMIKDKRLADGLLKDFSMIQIDYEASSIEAEGYVELNEDILKNVLNKFVSKSNDYCWRIYFYLAGQSSPMATADLSSGSDAKALEFDYAQAAKYLGISDKPTEKGYREMLSETLKQLDEKYGLLEYAPVWNKNGIVKLKDPSSPAASPDSAIEIPRKFWEYGWDRRLSLSAQFCYFINLIEGGQSHREWIMSNDKLKNKYKVGRDVINIGMAELRYWNIVQIRYGIVELGKNYGTREANRYKLKDLYKLEDFEVELKKLYDKYGEERVSSARKWAEIIFCENDLAEIEEIIRLVDEYGKDKVLAAFNKVAPWDEANPKRSMAYLKGIPR